MKRGGIAWLVARARAVVAVVSLRAVRVILLTCLCALSPALHADLISTTITVDGLFGDWTAVLANTSPQQYASDPEGLSTGTDRDRTVQSTGRDLKTFAYTWDINNLYFYVERWGSTKNRNWWWFYLDLDANGRMESTDKVLLVEWFGANQLTNTILYNYVPATGSDPLVCEISANCPFPGQVGVADGYDMLGGISGGTSIYSSVVGGHVDGVRLEARMPWSVLSPPGKRPLGFHVSSSNSGNLPGQIDDNMDGPGGNFMFVDNFDLAVVKTSNAVLVAGTPQAAGKSQFNYILTVTNNAVGGSANAGIARNVTLSDVLPSQVALVSATPTQGTFSSNVWTIGTLNPGATVTLTLRVLVNNPPNTSPNEALPITVTNTANNLRSPLGYDTNTGNNQSSTPVTLHPAPNLVVTKSSSLFSDPVVGTGPGTKYHIPGAVVQYQVVIQNTATFATGQSVVIRDPVPTQTAYVPGTITVGGVAKTDTSADGDGVQFDGTTKNVIIDLGTVNVSSTTTVTFKAQVQ